VEKQQEPWPVFTDKRAKAGIPFRHVASPTPDKYLLETMGGGVALLDYDNDGWLDIYLINSGVLRHEANGGQVRIDRTSPAAWNRLYRNNKDGSFTDSTQKARVAGPPDAGYGMGAAVGDINNDGFADLYVTNFGQNVLYLNKGDGRFEDITAHAGVSAGGWSASAGFLDFNQDGFLDLFVTRYLDWDFSKHVACGEPMRTYCPPTRHEPISNLLFRNNRDNTFTDVSASSGIAALRGKSLGVAFHDVDGDGRVDIAVANDSVGQMLFLNRGHGTFEDVSIPAGVAFNEDGLVFSGMGIDLSDFNNDGRADLVITNLAKELYALYRNEGDRLFSYVTRTTNLGSITAFMSGWGTRFCDFDHDGWKDLFAAQGHVLDNVERVDPKLMYRQPPLLARNVRGRFFDYSARSGSVFQHSYAARGAATGDLDNDGDIDIVVSVLDGAPLLLYSEASRSLYGWLLVQAVGARSPRDGQGAAIKIVTPDGNAQWNYVSTSGSYLSAGDSRVHFGLGTQTKVATLEIHWPSGRRQVLKDLTANRILTVHELMDEKGAR
jgi:hypothetical protein